MPGESAILNWTLALPAVGGTLVFLFPAAQAKRARPFAMIVLAATLAIAIIAASWFDWNTPAGALQPLQLTAHLPWIRILGASWNLGVDSLSMPLVLLTAAIGFFACWASYGIHRSPRAYSALLLWSVAALLGAFVAQDLLLFFAFFELALIPLYFLIGIWGGVRKEYAASKFFLFSMTAAIALLVAVILIFSRTHALGAAAPGSDANAGLLNFTDLATNGAAKIRLSGLTGSAAFWILLGACALSMGAAPFHTWLGDVLTEAPMPVALLIVAVVTKLGAYTLLRIGWPLFPATVGARAPLLEWLAAIFTLYAALAALAQRDLRRLIAFGSVAQMGLILLGIASAVRPFDPTRPFEGANYFPLASIGAAGAAFQLIAHALTTGMAVLVAGNIVERTGHSDIRRLGGLGGHMPALGAWAAIAFLACMGLPGMCGFVGELLILLGAFSAHAGPAATLAAISMVLLSVGYVWTYQRIFMGAPRPEHANVAGLSTTQKWLLAIFGILVIVLGLLPGFLLDPLRTWAEAWSRTTLMP